MGRDLSRGNKIGADPVDPNPYWSMAHHPEDFVQ
jgi:hypothetical protein